MRNTVLLHANNKSAKSSAHPCSLGSDIVIRSFKCEHCTRYILKLVSVAEWEGLSLTSTVTNRDYELSSDAPVK